MVRHYVLTLDGSAQRLSDVLDDGAAEGPFDRGVRAMSIQPGAANANAAFVGGAAVSATVYGVRLESAAAGVPPAPFVLGEFGTGAMMLSEFYVIGTSAEKLHILAVVDY